MTRESLIFDFEKDFAGSLRCIPMSVRLKLDRCGVKLSLRQWNRFTPEDRSRFLELPCDTAETRQSYQRRLVSLIEACGDESKPLAVETHPAWENDGQVPSQLSAYLAALQLPPLSLSQWAGLQPVQRFALLKLSRAGHGNDNFEPALREFGLRK